ncbi:hypothetical protein [Microbacterium sp. A1-JK]|uniref:hypothetical protein n=1 Tax=Microbacterium sp. A1-JK TaxID=3177516 RepID=UPI003883DB37
MPQTSTVQEPRLAVLKWQVVETSFIDTWVIAAFDLEDDANAYAEVKNRRDRLATFSVREDPNWTRHLAEARELRHSPALTLGLAESDL